VLGDLGGVGSTKKSVGRPRRGYLRLGSTKSVGRPRRGYLRLGSTRKSVVGGSQCWEGLFPSERDVFLHMASGAEVAEERLSERMSCAGPSYS
jgi:hypothetical protein